MTFIISSLGEVIILKSAAKHIVFATEEYILRGLGERIAKNLPINTPTPQEFVGTKDTFWESGTPEQLMGKYGLNSS